MIKNIPSMEEVTAKVLEIVTESADRSEPILPDAPLIAEQGLDSLDLIETSFSLQEFFDFEFSDKNAIEELENAVGDHSIIAENGVITAHGREMLVKRMPELAEVELPEDLTPMVLQKYFTPSTFARLTMEFYEAAPQTWNGEAVEVRDFKVVTESGKAVKMPGGDTLIESWVAEMTPALKS